jgi:hypothetical protein
MDMAIPKPLPDLRGLLEEAVREFVEEQVANLPELTPDEKLAALKAALVEQYGRDSDRMAAVRPFGPDSLVGSYFRAPDQMDPDAEAAWLDNEACRTVEGMVIRQPFVSATTAVYLVEFFGQHGAAGYQQLVELDRMLHQRWLFYDSDTWLASRPTEDQPESVVDPVEDAAIRKAVELS